MRLGSSTVDRLGGNEPYHFTSTKMAPSSSLLSATLEYFWMTEELSESDPTIVEVNSKRYIDFIRSDQEERSS